MEGFKFGGSDHKMEMVVGSVKMDGLGWGEMEPAEGNAAGWAGSGNPLCNVPFSNRPCIANIDCTNVNLKALF